MKMDEIEIDNDMGSEKVGLDNDAYRFTAY